MEPTQLGPFNIVRKLGEGGMGAVFEGENAQGQRVAIKLLSPAVSGRRGIRERFELEIETLRKLDHPNIVKLYGFGEQDNQLYYTMEMVAGVNLEDKLTAGYRFKWREAAKIGVFLCRALQHAHDRGIVHRDIKPENVMLTNQGRVKLADFGIARIWGVSNVTNPGGLIGTANYMSPEQASGQPVSPRSDMYSLGMTLYALIVGRPAFIGDSLPQLLKMHIEAKPKSLSAVAPDVPEAFDKLIMRLLTKEAEKRIANPEALARRLEDLLRDEGRQAKEKAKRLNEMGEDSGSAKGFDSFDEQMKKPRESSIKAPSISPDSGKRAPMAKSKDVADDDLGKTIIATGGKKPKMPAAPMDLQSPGLAQPPQQAAGAKGKLTELPKSMEPYEPDEPQAPIDASDEETHKSIRKGKVQAPTAMAGGQKAESNPFDLDLDEEEPTAPRMKPRSKAPSTPIEAPPGLDLDLEDSVEVPPESHMNPAASGSIGAMGSSFDEASSYYSTKAEADAAEKERKRQEEQASPRRIEINGPLVGGFILFVIAAVILFYVVKPPSADALLARLEPLKGSSDFARLAEAEGDLRLFLNKYLEHEKTKEMEALLEEVEVAIFVENPSKRFKWSDSDVAAAELIVNGIMVSKTDPEEGLRRLDAALGMHIDLVEKLQSGKKLDIKKRRLQKTLSMGMAKRKQLAVLVNERRASQLKHLEIILQEATMQKTLNPIKARTMLNGVIYLYKGKVWAAEKVMVAEQMLSSLPNISGGGLGTGLMPTPITKPVGAAVGTGGGSNTSVGSQPGNPGATGTSNSLPAGSENTQGATAPDPF